MMIDRQALLLADALTAIAEAVVLLRKQPTSDTAREAAIQLLASAEALLREHEKAA